MCVVLDPYNLHCVVKLCRLCLPPRPFVTVLCRWCCGGSGDVCQSPKEQQREDAGVALVLQPISCAHRNHPQGSKEEQQT